MMAKDLRPSSSVFIGKPFRTLRRKIASSAPFRRASPTNSLYAVHIYSIIDSPAKIDTRLLQVRQSQLVMTPT